MKKSYLYFIVPLLLTAVFGVYYWRYASVYDERIAKIEAEHKADLDKKRSDEAKAREKAIADAQEQTEKRKKAKAEKEAREAKEREERERAAQERNKAHEESRKFADKVKALQKEVTDNKTEIAKIEQDQKELVDEEKYLREFAKQADANTQALTGVIQKIDDAEKARAEAERAAAAAKKSS